MKKEEFRRNCHIILELANELQAYGDDILLSFGNIGFNLTIDLYDGCYLSGKRILHAQISVYGKGLFLGEINDEDIYNSGRKETALEEVIGIMTDRLIWLKENRNGGKSNQD